MNNEGKADVSALQACSSLSTTSGGWHHRLGMCQPSEASEASFLASRCFLLFHYLGYGIWVTADSQNPSFPHPPLQNPLFPYLSQHQSNIKNKKINFIANRSIGVSGFAPSGKPVFSPYSAKISQKILPIFHAKLLQASQSLVQWWGGAAPGVLFLQESYLQSSLFSARQATYIGGGFCEIA